MSVTVAAVDLGASSGRVMVARVSPTSVELREVARFDNTPVAVAGTLYWNILSLYHGVVEGLRCAAEAGDVDSIGIDSWGVDYGLLDAEGKLIGNPIHYRDSRTASLPPLDIYAESGIQYLPFNTVYQLLAPGGQPPAANTLLLIPDLLTYWLTGTIGAELTNASTTSLMDVHTRQWHVDLMRRVGIRPSLFPPLRTPGTPAGPALPSTGLPPIPVTAVGSHDTASAVAAVPASSPNFAYISCGTWSLVGVELDHPVVMDAARNANFTNEIGVDGTVRFLRNVMGLWLLQESLRAWPDAALDGLLRAAASLPTRAVIDPDDPVFLPPGDMLARITAACRASGQPVPDSPAAFVRCIIDSLAQAHRRAIDDARRLSGKPIDAIHIVGGGAKNALLCQLTADACGLPVEAGPVEATALGNAVIQARALGALPDDLAALRALLRTTQSVTRYEPA